MREPRRLRDGAESLLERALLDAGASYRGSPDLRAKTLAALGVAGSATLLAGATSVSSLAKVTWTKLLVGVSLLGVAGAVPVGYYAWQRRHAPPAGHVAPAAALAQAPAVAPPAPLPPLLVRHALARRARPAPVGPTLTRELAALDAARASLAGGDAGRALGRLNAYARAYPHGRLALEAEVLQIDALAQSGRGEAARQRAEAFLRRHPDSVFAARVRRHLDE